MGQSAPNRESVVNAAIRSIVFFVVAISTQYGAGKRFQTYGPISFFSPLARWSVCAAFSRAGFFALWWAEGVERGASVQVGSAPPPRGSAVGGIGSRYSVFLI
jgi:hypothetical protein